MSYQLYDVKGYVADMATVTGLVELLDFLREQDNAGLKELGSDLSTAVTPETIAAINALPTPRSETLAETLADFKKSAAKCKKVMIIGNGVVEDDGTVTDEGMMADGGRGGVAAAIAALRANGTELQVALSHVQALRKLLE